MLRYLQSSIISTMNRPEKICQKIIGHKVNLGTFSLDHKDFILYALGIGFSRDPMATQDFAYTYELSPSFTSFPTYASCLGQQTELSQLANNQHLPDFPFHTILHGEERLYMVHPKLQVGGTYQVESQIIDVIDRGEGKGVFIVDRISGYLVDQKAGERSLAYYVDRNTFARSIGGSGVKSTGKLKPIPNPPKRKHDLLIEEKTFPNQAILYRLNSDPNPLHIDPENAKKAGFPRPIIHGLATYGTIVRSIVQNVLDNDAGRVASVQTRFTGHVFPGQGLNIKLWKEGGKLFFEVQTAQRKTKAAVGVISVRESAKL